MKSKTYKYHTNRQTIIATIIYLVVLSVIGVLIWYLYVGGYFSAWFISLVVALIALIAISIPRRIIVDQEAITIVCMLEITDILISEVACVRKVEPNESRWLVPLFGSRGFFGYFGYYINLSTLDRVQLYATEWQNLVEIVDIYDDHYYISCRQVDGFIAQVESCIDINKKG